MTNQLNFNETIEWGDHMNNSWSIKDADNLASRDVVQAMYESLLTNKEIKQIPDSVITYADIQLLPDFLYELPHQSELEQYVVCLLTSQLELAKNVSSSTPFATILKQRLLILKRIYHALVARFHESEKPQVSTSNTNISTTGVSGQLEPLCGSQALLEIGVQSGLSLLFALLRQNWQDSSMLGMQPLCNPVLQTANEIIDLFPPLSLSNDTQITPLGIKCLHKVSAFLKEVVLKNNTVDTAGRILASELLLSLSLQRGSLRYLLEWIEMAFDAMTVDTETEITSAKFNLNLSLKLNQTQPLEVNDCDEEISLYDGAYRLMERLVEMAIDYGDSYNAATNSTHTSPVNTTGETNESSDVFVWGSNSSHQLAEGNQEKIMIPIKSKVFQQVQQVEAGQYCTFIIHFDGKVSACGKGSYGRLGLGDSANQNLPKRVLIDTNVRMVSSSKGSDGHTLALTDEGSVYSWGDGDYGKLGHGTCTTHKQPKLVMAPFTDKVIKCIQAGYRHSAAVSEDGLLYTWGEGDHGRLGHGDTTGRQIPTLVRDLTNVGSVACGSAHTLAVAKDGKTVWSFGSADSGRLGHGIIAKVYRPKVIEGLQGLNVRKVCAGALFSMALTKSGQVYTWGSGASLGVGSTDTMHLSPTLVNELGAYRIVDIAAGDGHCLALTDEYEVFAWGTNAMGQCGQGHTNGPITRPHKVSALSGFHIRQISAGTSHSLAWTSIPLENQQITRHKPFCLDLHEKTFELLKIFLDKYAKDFYAPQVPKPFKTSQEHHKFVLLCLKLLQTHLTLCKSGGLGKNILGPNAKPLRGILFGLIDTSTPADIDAKVRDVICVGAALLLPDLKERIELLNEQLPIGEDLSQGKEKLLRIILHSLEEPGQVAALLGFNSVPEKLDHNHLHLTEELMKTLLVTFSCHTEEILDSAAEYVETNKTHQELDKWKTPANPHTPLLRKLLSSLQNHLLADFVSQNIQKHPLDVNILRNHLNHLFPLATKIITKAKEVVEGHMIALDLLFNALLESIAGSMLLKVLNSLLLMNSSFMKDMLPMLLVLMEALDQLNRLLPIDVLNDIDFMSSGSATPTLTQLTDQAWIWLTDLEKTCSLLIGQCLGGILIGEPLVKSEVYAAKWMSNVVFSNGISEDKRVYVHRIKQISYFVMANCHEQIFSIIGNFSNDQHNNLKVALNLPDQYDEACACDVEKPADLDTGNFYTAMIEAAGIEIDPFYIEDDKDTLILDTIVRCFLFTCLKHFGLLDRSKDNEYMQEIYKCALTLRQLLMNIACNSKCNETDSSSETKEGKSDMDEDDDEKDFYEGVNYTDYKFYTYCKHLLSRTLYVLLCLEPLNFSNDQLKSTTEDYKQGHAHYINTYEVPVKNETMRRLCASLLSFVCDEPADKQPLSNNSMNGWSTELPVINDALHIQKDRAIDRLNALELIYDLMLKSRNDPSITVHNCIQQQLLAGCFGMFSTKSEESCTQLHHYLEGISASPVRIQENIRKVVHNIYKLLVESLQANSSDCSKKQLQLLTIFSLSTRYHANDLTLVIESGLLPILMDMYNYLMVPKHIISKTQMLNVAALRLTHILAMSCCIHARDISAASVESVIDKLFLQFSNIVTNKPSLDHDQKNQSTFIRCKNNYDRLLGDFLVFLRMIASETLIQKYLAKKHWIDVLFHVLHSQRSDLELRLSLYGLRPKLIVLQILQIILPGLKSKHLDTPQRSSIVDKLFTQLSFEVWGIINALERDDVKEEQGIIEDTYVWLPMLHVHIITFLYIFSGKIHKKKIISSLKTLVSIRKNARIVLLNTI